MTKIPLDRTDLRLAPVALELDATLVRWGSRSAQELRSDIVLRSNMHDTSRTEREGALLQALAHDVDLHGWQLTLDARGLRLSHGLHALVLGLPPQVRDYLQPARVLPRPRS